MNTTDPVPPSATDLNALAQKTVQDVSDRLNDQANVLRHATATARYQTEDFILSRPWTAVALAGLIGFALGAALTGGGAYAVRRR